MSYENDEEVAAKKRVPLDAEIIPFYLEKLDAIAKENNGHFALGKVNKSKMDFMKIYVKYLKTISFLIVADVGRFLLHRCS